MKFYKDKECSQFAFSWPFLSLMKDLRPDISSSLLDEMANESINNIIISMKKSMGVDVLYDETGEAV